MASLILSVVLGESQVCSILLGMHLIFNIFRYLRCMHLRQRDVSKPAQSSVWWTELTVFVTSAGNVTPRFVKRLARKHEGVCEERAQQRMV